MSDSIIKFLVERTKDENYRNNMTADDFIPIKESFTLTLSDLNKSDEEYEDLLNYLRVFRNSCVNCPKNQNILKTLEITKLVASFICSNSFEDNSTKTVTLVSIQFMGNYVTGNFETQLAAWPHIYPDYIKAVLNCTNFKAISAVSMVLFNCLKTDQFVKQILTENNGREIVKSLLNLWKQMEKTDWLCLCISEYFLFNKQFLLFVFEECCTEIQDHLLLHIETWLRKENQKWQRCVSVSLSEIFSTISARVLGNCFNNSGGTLFLMMKVLCPLSGNEECIEHLQKSNVLRNSVQLLLNLNQTEIKSDVSKQLNQTLIQLIGNLCYRNKTNQDFIRITGVLPVIMNNCNINESTPYVQQWAILALRNLCENNKENQNEIARLEKVGIADSPVLKEMGIQVEETADGKFQLKFNK